MKTSCKVAAWLASFSAICGLFVYAIAPEKITPTLILLAITVLSSLYLGISERRSLFRLLKTSSRLAKGVQEQTQILKTYIHYDLK